MMCIDNSVKVTGRTSDRSTLPGPQPDRHRRLRRLTSAGTTRRADG